MSAKEVLDLGGSRRRRSSGPKEGCVWESRIMVDQVKDGIEILVTHDCVEENTKNTCNSSISSPSSSTMNNGEIQVDKRVDNIRPKQSPVGVSSKRIIRQRSQVRKNLDEQCKESGVSSDGIKKSPVQIKKTSVRNEIGSVQLRKVKSDSTKALNESKSELRKMNSDGNLENSLSLQLVKAKTHTNKSEEKKVGDESNKDLGEPVGGIEESTVGIKKSRSEEDCKELRAITTNVGNEAQIQIITTPPNVDHVDGEEEEEEEVVDKEIEVEVEKKSLDNKDISITVQEQKPKKLVIKEKKLLLSNERSAPISDNFHRTPSKLQSFADLIMWRDVSKSAFIFGIGAFAIMSSSYTKDLNISFISVLSYLGLVYLGVSFVFRSLIRRGSMDMDNTKQEYVVGEEEAVWLIKLVLPYVNEFLLKLRSLFSGDPSTTMKLAVLLFILARCGGSITIWKMTKLGFFGVFMVPKLCSSYASHLAAHGTFWIRRFGDAWESCSHKKAVGFGIFTLVWNLSSVVARIWAVFVLFVAFKYYQQWWIKEEEPTTANSNSQYAESIGRQVRDRRSTITQVKKQKEVMC